MKKAMYIKAKQSIRKQVKILGQMKKAAIGQPDILENLAEYSDVIGSLLEDMESTYEYEKKHGRKK